MVVRVCSFRFTGPCIAALRMMSSSSSNSFHDFLSSALGHLILGFLWLVAGSWRGLPKTVACSATWLLSPETFKSRSRRGSSSSTPGSWKTSCVVSWTESSSIVWFESSLEYSCVSLAKPAKRCPCGLARWQPDFPWWIRRPCWFLQTLLHGQVTVPGAAFVVDWPFLIDSITSIQVSLSSSLPLGRLRGCLSLLESVACLWVSSHKNCISGCYP